MNDNICVLGETLEQAIWLLDQLCEANQDDIYRRRKDVAIMNDGSVLLALGVGILDNFWGCTFDYVFYEKDQLRQYCANYPEAMEYLEKRCLVRSVVPREFQWCIVDTMLV